MTRRILLSLALSTVLAGSALADDLTPPPWRFNAGTTVQHWDFSSGPTGFAPDALPLNNSYGSPAMIPAGGATWLPAFSGRNDVWDITAGALNFDIPNVGMPTHQKDLWLQVTFFGLAPVINPAIVVASSSGANFNLVGGPFNTILPNGWVHQLTQWNLPVCPQLEHVTISPGFAGAPMVIDQVVIDTQCIIPSPAAASLLGLGSLTALRRRRRTALS